jgi:aminoglycoside phosphotransferase (APT) family kinase protein
LNQLIGDTLARRVTLVHGDFSPKNILVRDGKLILLDHEVIHWGDPAFDVGFGLTHFLSKAHHLRDHRFIEAATRFCEAYGDEVDEQAARQTLGCLLARVAGRSPLEYLDERERARQRRVVVKLIQDVPAIPDLFERFWVEINAND